MEKEIIDILIGMVEDNLKVDYNEFNGDVRYYVDWEFESTSEIKSWLDKIGVEYRRTAF